LRSNDCTVQQQAVTLDLTTIFSIDVGMTRIAPRLRLLGYSVVEHQRPGACDDDLSSNYGGIVIFSSPSIQLSEMPFGCPSTFEALCIHVTTGRRSEILVVIYRPGSQSIQTKFFDDLASYWIMLPPTRRPCSSLAISPSTGLTTITLFSFVLC
jgi:hypothetical protein